MKKEKEGELWIVLAVTTFSLFPIVTNYVTKILPPLFFAGIHLLVAAVFVFIYAVARGSFWVELKAAVRDRSVLWDLVRITLFNIIIPFILIFVGTRMTSGINTALLLQSEVVFTFIFCVLFFKEKITRQRMLGAGVLLIGAITILYQGNFTVNGGDLFIIAGTALFPFGNFYMKRAMQKTSATQTLLFRTFFGGLILLGASVLFEQYTAAGIVSLFTGKIIALVLISGILLQGIGKFFWFAGLKILDISKAVAMIVAGPALSLFFAMIFLKEVPTKAQLIGLVIIMVGFFILTPPDMNIETTSDEGGM